MKKMTIEEYDKKLQEKYPKDNLSCLEYSLMTKPCIIQCNNCGKIYSFTQGQFALKRKDIFCKKCKDSNKWKETKEKFKNWLNYQQNFTLIDDLSDIHDSQQHVKCRCNKCGKVQENKKIYDYLRGIRCYCETKSSKKTEQILRKELDNEYDFSFEEYVNTDTKMSFIHKKCGQDFIYTPRDLLRNYGFCPNCNKNRSHGENIIRKLLVDASITFIEEYQINIDKQTLRLDFFLPKDNIAIEFNGIQHYQSVQHFGGQKAFIKRQRYDNIKKQWCERNNIKLIIIKYNEDILKRLKMEGVIK